MAKMNILRKIVGDFLSNQINTLIIIDKLMKNKQMKYPYLISNTDRFDQPGTH